MLAQRALAAYLVSVLIVGAGVVAYQSFEVYGRLPIPEPSVITDVRIVDAPYDRTFEAMSDVSSWARLQGVERAKLVPGSDPPVVEARLSEFLLSIDVRAEYEAQPPDWQRLRVVGGYLDGATITQTFEPSGSGTKVSTVAKIDMRAFSIISETPETLVRERLAGAVSALEELAGQAPRLRDP